MRRQGGAPGSPFISATRSRHHSIISDPSGQPVPTSHGHAAHSQRRTAGAADRPTRASQAQPPRPRQQFPGSSIGGVLPGRRDEHRAGTRDGYVRKRMSGSLRPASATRGPATPNRSLAPSRTEAPYVASPQGTGGRPRRGSNTSTASSGTRSSHSNSTSRSHSNSNSHSHSHSNSHSNRA